VLVRAWRSSFAAPLPEFDASVADQCPAGRATRFSSFGKQAGINLFSPETRAFNPGDDRERVFEPAVFSRSRAKLLPFFLSLLIKKHHSLCSDLTPNYSNEAHYPQHECPQTRQTERGRTFCRSFP